MKDLNDAVFNALVREACLKCFGLPLTVSLSETDSKVLSNEIFEKTGLVIGIKSIKNYSIYVLSAAESRKENPSVATLDTLARYVLEAPVTDEVTRKKQASHHPYWFQYRSRFVGTHTHDKTTVPLIGRTTILAAVIMILLIALIFYFKPWIGANHKGDIVENFNSVREDSLQMNGWSVKNKAILWWSKRNQEKGHVALFTLRGDNWGNGNDVAGIRNLLVRNISADCFAAEIHLTDFFPGASWQQAGIILSEDSSFSDKAIRLSISYNDFFGGYERSPEILIQAISSAESGRRSKPEEIAHLSLFSIEPGHESLVENNLSRSALKIEKKGNQFRFLYSTGSTESFAFKEVVSANFNLKPVYIGLFAIQGFSDHEDPLAVKFDSFRLTEISCH